MKIRGMILAAGLLAASCFSMMALAADKAAAESVDKTADKVATMEWDKISKECAPLAKKHELLDIMNLMKKRDAKAKISGVGIGEKAGAITPDGIEAKIINMSKNPMAKATLDKQAEALIRMAERTAAVASIGVHLCPVEKKEGKKDPAKWKGWMEDQYKVSQDLIKALKKKDANAVKEAANRLNGVCTECHNDFKE